MLLLYSSLQDWASHQMNPTCLLSLMKEGTIIEGRKKHTLALCCFGSSGGFSKNKELFSIFLNPPHMFLCHSETVKRCQSLPLWTRHLCNGVKRKLCSVLIHIKIVQKKYFQHLHQYWSPLCMGSIVDWLLQNLIQNAWVGGTLVLSFNLELLTRNGILIRFLQIGKSIQKYFNLYW